MDEPPSVVVPGGNRGVGRVAAREKPLKPRARDGGLARRLWDDAEGVRAAV